MKRKPKAFTLFAMAVAIALLIIDASIEPSKWREDLQGITRQQLHTRLGTPQAEFFPTKSFDGYSRDILIGKRYLTVRYSNSDDVNRNPKVIAIERGICAGEFWYCAAIQRKS